MPLWVIGPTRGHLAVAHPFRGVRGATASLNRPIFEPPKHPERLTLDYMSVYVLVQGTSKNVQKIWQCSMTSFDDVTGVFIAKFANFLSIRHREVLFLGPFVHIMHVHIFSLARYVNGLYFKPSYKFLGIFIAEL